DTALEVDHMILDYLAYQCITGRLEFNAHPPSQDLVLQNNQYLFDAFLPTFKARHPHFKPDPHLGFRLGLLKFITLYKLRLTRSDETPSPEALEILRSNNQTRAVRWIRDPTRIPSSASSEIRKRYDTALPIPQSALIRNRSLACMRAHLEPEGVRHDNSFYRSGPNVSLLDLLPMFMEISAMINAIFNGAGSEIWIRLAAEFMMQACIEQYLIYGAYGTDAIDEAFAHGYQPDLVPYDANIHGSRYQATDTEHKINAMFEHPDFAIEIPNWTKLKKSYLLELLAPESTDIPGKLQQIAQSHPVGVFHDELMDFMEGISQAIPKPILVQLESERLDGLTQQETKAFIDNCG
ncbi:hypothetical protein K431DRAFT_188936, partial [Polychaeton citri CBS 116435]